MITKDLNNYKRLIEWYTRISVCTILLNAKLQRTESLMMIPFVHAGLIATDDNPHTKPELVI
jgi:hypothetical protein